MGWRDILDEGEVRKKWAAIKTEAARAARYWGAFARLCSEGDPDPEAIVGRLSDHLDGGELQDCEYERASQLLGRGDWRGLARWAWSQSEEARLKAEEDDILLSFAAAISLWNLWREKLGESRGEKVPEGEKASLEGAPGETLELMPYLLQSISDARDLVHLRGKEELFRFDLEDLGAMENFVCLDLDAIALELSGQLSEIQGALTAERRLGDPGGGDLGGGSIERFTRLIGSLVDTFKELLLLEHEGNGERARGVVEGAKCEMEEWQRILSLFESLATG
jgi:hypothetical protein